LIKFYRSTVVHRPQIWQINSNGNLCGYVIDAFHLFMVVQCKTEYVF